MSNNFGKNIFLRQAGLISSVKFKNDICRKRVLNIELSRLREVVVAQPSSDEQNDESEPLMPGNHNSTVNSLHLDGQEGRYLLAGCADGSIYIHDLANFCGEPEISSKLVGKIEPVAAPPTSVPSNRRNLMTPQNNRIQHKNGHSQSVETVQWYPGDNGIFVTSSADQRLLVWDSNTLSIAEEFQISRTIFCHQIAQPPSTLVAVASASNHVRLIDLKSGSHTHELRGHTGWNLFNIFIYKIVFCEHARSPCVNFVRI